MWDWGKKSPFADAYEESSLYFQIVPCMVQNQSKDGGQYRASGWLGVITAGKLWTDFRGVEESETRIAEQSDALLLEIANKLNVGK